MTDVTVVVAVWDDYVRYLDDALASLQSQTPQPHIVLVDNGSRMPIPGTPGAEVIKTGERVTLGAARTIGLSHVRTEFVIFWDADDVMPPETIAQLHERMCVDAKSALAAARIVEGEGRPHHWPRRFTNRLARWQTLFALANAVSSLVPSVGVMVRTAVARDAGGFADLDAGEDWVFGASLAFRGRVHVIDHVGRIYHRHTGSVWTRGQTTPHRMARARAVRRSLSNDPGVPARIRRALPAVALGQWLVIWILGPTARMVRSVHGGAR